MRRIQKFLTAFLLIAILLVGVAPKASAAAWQSFMWRSTNSGSSWSQPEIAGSDGGWVSMAASSDGTKVIAGQFNQSSQNLVGSNVYRSSDSGATWTKITALGDGIWFGLASSADGTKLAAANAYTGYVYLSTDSGATWAEQTDLGLGAWTSLAMSSDGSKIFAGQGSVMGYGYNTGLAYLSTDSGANWVEQTALGAGNWWSASMSSDGAIVTAVDVNAAKIYKYDANAIFDAGYHIQSGMTWIDITDVQMNSGIYTVRVSGDGSTIVLTEGAYLNTANTAWLSVDSGVHWTNLSGGDLPETTYASVSLSSNGHTIMLGGYGSMYTSTDQGVSWDPIVELGDLGGIEGNGGFWYSSVMSADGTTRYVSQYNFNPSDTDGIDYNTEEAAPNSGDANDDGSADSGQNNVASFVNPVTDHYASLAVDDTCDITEVSVAPESDNTAQDTDHSYPLGLMNFTLDCGASGHEATITQYYYGSDADIATLSVRKYNATTHQYQAVPSASVSRQTIDGQSAIVISYTVTDGGVLDSDGEANGTIVDPTGLALADTTAESAATLASTGRSTEMIVATSLAFMASSSLFVLIRRRQY